MLMEPYALLILFLAVVGAIVWDLLARGAAERRRKKQEQAERAGVSAAAPGHYGRDATRNRQVR